MGRIKDEFIDFNNDLEEMVYEENKKYCKEHQQQHKIFIKNKRKSK